MDAKLKAALCADPNSEYIQLLNLARLFEEARWPEADQMIQQLGMDAAKVKGAFQAAVAWASDLADMVASSKEVS